MTSLLRLGTSMLPRRDNGDEADGESDCLQRNFSEFLQSRAIVVSRTSNGPPGVFSASTSCAETTDAISHAGCLAMGGRQEVVLIPTSDRCLEVVDAGAKPFLSASTGKVRCQRENG
jgi:hypothetical protein